MAEEMASTPNGFDPITSWARLSERVEGQGKDIVDLRSNMNTGFQTLTASVNQLSNETRAAVAQLSSAIAERSRPNIQAYGFMLSVALAVGALAYWPIRESTNDLKLAVQVIAERTVTREEMDWRSARGQEDRVRSDAAIADLRAGTVTRNEWMERNQSRDHDIENIRADIEREVANVQRQIDLQRNDFLTFSNSLGNGRDFIQDLKAEVARLRDQLAEIRARQFQRFGAASPPP